MLTLKIRVPYKLMTPMKFLEIVDEQLAGLDIIGCEANIIENLVVVQIPNGLAPNETLDMRVLEVIDD